MPLTPGSRLGPYEIQSALGAGGMGEVYKARDTKLKRDVAIKEGGGTDQTAVPTSLVVVQNWVEELKRLVPTN